MADSHARARALGRARVAAAEFVSGVTVRSGVLSFQAVRDQDSSELVEVLSQVFALAVVVDERVVAKQVSPLPGGGFWLDLALRAKGRDLCLHGTSAQSELGAYFRPGLPGPSERRQV